MWRLPPMNIGASKQAKVDLGFLLIKKAQAGQETRQKGVMRILRTRIGEKNSKAGQQIIEYAVILAAISLALTVMYVYAKRGLQSTIKDTVDKEIGPQVDSEPIMAPEQYQKSNSVVTALGSDTARVVKNSEEASYYFNSAATSTTVSNTVSNQLDI